MLILSVLFNVIAQLLLKKGVQILADLHFSLEAVAKLITAIFSNLYLFGGMFCFGLSALLWLFVLSKMPVSIAYPLGSLGYILTAILAFFLLNEPLTISKIIGILLICIGVFVLVRN